MCKLERGGLFFYSGLDFVGFVKKKYMRFLQSTGLLPISHQARHTCNKNSLNILISHKSWTWTQAFNSSMDRRPKILTAISLGSEAKSVPLSMLVHLRFGHLRFLVLNWSDIGVIGGTFFWRKNYFNLGTGQRSSGVPCQIFEKL